MIDRIDSWKPGDDDDDDDDETWDQYDYDIPWLRWLSALRL